MSIANMRIGARLGLGFGVVLLLMVFLIAIAVSRSSQVKDVSAQMFEKDWAKAEAAGVIDTMTRANARNTLELLVVTDAAQVEQIHARIEANKKVISAALDRLEKLIYQPEGRELLGKLRAERVRFVASFTAVDKMVAAQRRDEAVALMQKETLPALDVLQVTVSALSALQKKLVEAGSQQVSDSIDFLRVLMLSVGVVALLVGAACAWWISRSITRPIIAAVKAAQTVATGDLSGRIEVVSHDETGQLLQALKDMNGSLHGIVSQVRGGTEVIAAATVQIASGNLDLSTRTEQQAASLEETASSMEELTSTVKQNADNARQANQLAISASDVAREGGAVVARVVDTMGSINDSSRKIVDIISVIDGIAFQTNILALNAAVEAARAGEQGRGFAVVASEVRNLAQRSAAAAKEIKGLIGDSVERVEEGNKLVDQAGATMQAIVTSIQNVTDIMAEITAASQEQTSGIEQINDALVQMDDVTQQNAALVEQAAAAAAALQEQAGQLAQVVGVFTLSAAGRAPALQVVGGAGARRRLALRSELRS